jgi:hypothetical protein
VLNGATAGPAASKKLHFQKHSSRFSPSMALRSYVSASSPDALVFGIDLPADTNPGQYAVCYCNDQDDSSLEDFGDSDSTYFLSEDESVDLSSCPDSLHGSANVLGDRSVADHGCDTKCQQGCTGPFCYCDGFETGTDYLCLPKDLCKQACDEDDDCVGINVHDTKPQCVLIPSACTPGNGTATNVDEAWQLFMRTPGTACSQLSDFTEFAGTLTVTNRVDVGVDYVLHPGEPGSIELTPAQGASLTFTHPPMHGFTNSDALLSADRITIIDKYGSCGVSGPTQSLDLPENAGKIETWNALDPFSWFVDPPHEDAENPEGDAQMQTVAVRPSNVYAPRVDKYCAGGNMDVHDPANMVPIDGMMRSISEHQCYHKCTKNAPCSGDDCHCDGLYSGYDGPSSNALCANVALCQYMCDQLPGCVSIDMHQSRDRCFLNMGDMCGATALDASYAHQDDLKDDSSYTLLVKQSDPNQEPRPRRLLPVYDAGFSWGNMLRFKPIQFSSGGEFKLCFCDSTLVPGGRCAKASDYAIEVGSVHASGVSCLVQKPELQRVACAEQFHQGLRCYAHGDAPTPEPPRVDETALPTGDTVTDIDLATLCMYQPEEAACQTVSGFQSAQ